MRPLRRAQSSYGFIPKCGGWLQPSAMHEGSPSSTGRATTTSATVQGRFRGVSGPARFLIHPVSSHSSDRGAAYKTTPRPKRAAVHTRITSSSRQVSEDSYQTQKKIQRWAGPHTEDTNHILGPACRTLFYRLYTKHGGTHLAANHSRHSTKQRRAGSPGQPGLRVATGCPQVACGPARHTLFTWLHSKQPPGPGFGPILLEELKTRQGD